MNVCMYVCRCIYRLISFEHQHLTTSISPPPSHHQHTHHHPLFFNHPLTGLLTPFLLQSFRTPHSPPISTITAIAIQSKYPIPGTNTAQAQKLMPAPKATISRCRIPIPITPFDASSANLSLRTSDPVSSNVLTQLSYECSLMDSWKVKSW